MTTVNKKLDMLSGLGWMLDEELLAQPGVLRAMVLSADGLPVVCSKDIDRSQDIPRAMSERVAAAVTGLQAVSQESTEFASKPRSGADEPFSAGPWQRTLIQYEQAYIIIIAARAGTYLAVAMSQKADVEAVSYQMEKVVDRIGDYLGLPPRQPAPSAS
ncbi:roadblock/LC7 domain-containing protein [Streptomyces shenzhenensis]|uniref:roadblock/LC7 domain-containing protein n=1 Tax=Streptomyces shenzhenensis TaxID=943815 RepID=UPI0015F0665F|nr:roadblock/LC7 domain-containing protein [Streptomyces shenzhenensis]